MYTHSNFNDKQDLITKLVLILYMTLYALLFHSSDYVDLMMMA